MEAFFLHWRHIQKNSYIVLFNTVLFMSYDWFELWYFQTFLRKDAVYYIPPESWYFMIKFQLYVLCMARDQVTERCESNSEVKIMVQLFSNVWRIDIITPIWMDRYNSNKKRKFHRPSLAWFQNSTLQKIFRNFTVRYYRSVRTLTIKCCQWWYDLLNLLNTENPKMVEALKHYDAC